MRRAPAPPGPDEDDDGALLLRWRDGDERAFARLVDRYQDALYGFLLQRTRRPALAQELCQETFLRLAGAADGWSARGPVRAWLFRVARNLAIDHARRHATQREESVAGEDGHALERHADPADGPDAAAEGELLRTKLRAAVAELPEEQRDVLLLRHDDGLSFPEIAEVLGVPLNTCKSRLRYALETLRGHLADLERDRAS
ncbi:MAG: sigma-70 family RNA polymerase sigma factor [Deltaproteobacteria bacterium]|nr:MAG: sigma-70 family RNA polymerase sigma factor [Deltaproteobacteria bacterium]